MTIHEVIRGIGRACDDAERLCRVFDPVYRAAGRGREEAEKTAGNITAESLDEVYMRMHCLASDLKDLRKEAESSLFRIEE